MSKLWTVVIIVVALAILGGAGYGLYVLGDGDQSALERLRDIALIFIALMIVLTVLLLLVMTFVMVYVAFAIKNRIVPVMEALLDTAHRVKGTTDFLTEEVAAPVISVYGTVAKARAMTRVVTGRDKGNERKTTQKLLK